MAFGTDDIIGAIRAMRARGMEFLPMKPSYYTYMKKKIANSPIKVKEDLDAL